MSQFTFNGKPVREIDYRNKQQLKSLGFELVGEYMENFSQINNSKISLIGWDQPSIFNDNISKFLFVEHEKTNLINYNHFELPKESNSNNQRLVYFR